MKNLNRLLDTLVLIDGDVKFKYYNRNLEFDDNLIFNKISITAGKCFGNCSEFEMKIDKNNKKLNFYGIANCKVYGEYETILESKDIHKLDSIFKWTNLSKIDSTLYYGSIDDWSITMKIQYNDNYYKIIKGTYWELPYQLKPVMWYSFKILRNKKLM